MYRIWVDVHTLLNIRALLNITIHKEDSTRQFAVWRGGLTKTSPPFLRPKACSVCPFLPLRLQAILPKEKRLLDILKVLEVTRLDMNLGETPEKP